MGQETELKFIGPEVELWRLRDSPAFRRLAAKRRATTRALRSVYFDTDEFALRAAGVVLRVRDEGQGFVQTVKTIDGPDVATRTEIKSPVADGVPDIEAIDDKRIRRAMVRATRGSALKPIFTVEMQRTSVDLVPKRGVEIEAAFDIGRIATVDGTPVELPVSEFELELKSGDIGDLVACARELVYELPLTLCLQSKGARGYALAGGLAHSPVKPAPLVLPNDATASDSFGRIIAHCMNHLLGNWEAVAIARDPEGIHQMRVAIRRLRSALGLFGGPFRAALHPLEDDLRWLARVLGAARDLDVFDDEVFRPAADAHGEDVRFAALTATVRARRQDAWNDVLAVLASERFRRLMLSLAAAALGKAWLENATKAAGRPAALLARKRIAKRHAQAVKVGKKIEELDAQSRHKLRIRLKKLRYAVEFFSSLFPKGAVGTYLARLAALQEVLGHMNDAAVARSVVDGFLAGEQENAADVGYTCGVIAGWHLGHWREHRKALRRRWRSFAHLKPLWK